MILTVNGGQVGYTGCEEAKIFYHIIPVPFKEIWEYVMEFSGEKLGRHVGTLMKLLAHSFPNFNGATVEVELDK